MSEDIKFICEFTTNHMGNLNVLLEMVKKAAEAGADYIKMQKKDVENFYSKEKLNSTYSSPYGKTYRDYRKIFEFNKRDFDVFDQECAKYDIKWFSTAQDVKSLDFLLQYDLPMYKIASCNSNKTDMLKTFERMIPKDKTIVISCAGRKIEEIKNVIDLFKDHKMIINHCVAEYPCKKENLRFGNIKILKNLFETDRVKIGYSGHEEGVRPTLGAAFLGVSCIERHFCLSRESFVHHIECSLEPDEYKEMVELIKNHKYNENIIEELGELAFKSNFGMSEMEEAFLTKNTYGKEFIGDKYRK